MKKSLLMLLMCVAMVFCAGCGKEAQGMAYTTGEMTITLTDQFELYEQNMYDVAYLSDKAMMMAIHDTNEELAAAGVNVASLDEYADICIVAHGGLEGVQVQSAANYKYIEYEQAVDGVDYSYYCAFYQSSTGYWAVTFSAFPEDYEEQKPNIEKWASSVTFQ